MSPLVEVELVILRELRRTFRSAKGAVLAAFSVAGGAAVSMLFAWFDRAQRENLPPGLELSSARDALFEGMYGRTTGHALAGSPYPLWMMLVGTLWLSPLLVALMNFEAVSAERQSRSVRFWTVRIRRSSYLLGKYLAGWLAVLAVALAMNVIVWAVTIGVGHLAPSYVLGWGVRFFVVLLPITAAWCGIATLLGSQFKTPMLSLLVICVAFFGLWLCRIAAGLTHNEWLAYAYPSAFDALLLSPNAAEVGIGLLGTGAIVILTNVLGLLLFQKRDL